MKTLSLTLAMALIAATCNAIDLESQFTDDSLGDEEQQAEQEFERMMSREAEVPADQRYFFKDEYMVKSAQDKMTDLWSMLVPDASVVETPADLMWADSPHVFTQKAAGSFCNSTDEMRSNRKKTTHTQGVVAKASWVPVNTGAWDYTGFY